MNEFKFGPTALAENVPLCKSLFMIQQHARELILFTVLKEREINNSEITLSPSAVMGPSIQHCSSQL